MIRPNFTKKDIEAHLKKEIEKAERQMIARLRIIGEMAVTIARGQGNNDPSAFPIKYGDFKDPQPLKQRQITQRDKDRSKYVAAPQFGDFLSWTGNLTSSISYFICQDGQVIEEDAGSEEVAKSRKIARDAAKGRKGFVLVVVAGMEYAAAVEAKGYDVLSSSELWAQKEARKLLKKLGKRK